MGCGDVPLRFGPLPIKFKPCQTSPKSPTMLADGVITLKMPIRKAIAIYCLLLLLWSASLPLLVLCSQSCHTQSSHRIESHTCCGLASTYRGHLNSRCECSLQSQALLRTESFTLIRSGKEEANGSQTQSSLSSSILLTFEDGLPAGIRPSFAGQDTFLFTSSLRI